MATFDLLTGSSKQPLTMKIDEVAAFSKRLRYADKDTKKAARQANQRIAKRVVVEIRGAALFDPFHARQYAKFLPSVKAVQGTPRKSTSVGHATSEAPATGATNRSSCGKSRAASSSDRTAPMTAWDAGQVTSSAPAKRAATSCSRSSNQCKNTSAANTT